MKKSRNPVLFGRRGGYLYPPALSEGVLSDPPRIGRKGSKISPFLSRPYAGQDKNGIKRPPPPLRAGAGGRVKKVGPLIKRG
jgi:hypothetical protein